MTRLAACLATTAALLTQVLVALPTPAGATQEGMGPPRAVTHTARAASRARRGGEGRARSANRRGARGACGSLTGLSPRHQRVHALRCRPVPERKRGRIGHRPVAPATPPVAPTVSGQARAVTIARVLSTPCQDAQLIPEFANLRPVRAAVLCLINRERAQNGEAPLAASERLDRAAQGHSEEMISADYFEHVSPSGLSPVARIRSTGYIPNSEVGYVIGENIGWATLSLATPEATVAAWVASPEHLANILEGHYRDTGVGVVAEVPASLSGGSPGATYTQEFGVIVR